MDKILLWRQRWRFIDRISRPQLPRRSYFTALVAARLENNNRQLATSLAL